MVMSACLFGLAIASVAVAALSQTVHKAEHIGNPMIDPNPCSLVWPKFGDVYPVDDMVYFMFYCNLSLEQEMKLKADNGYMHINWGVFMYDMDSSGYTYLANGDQFVYANPSNGTISRDFKFKLFQKAPPGQFIMSMKFTMRISVADEHIDSMSAVITPAADDFLAKMLGEEETTLSSSCIDSLDQACAQKRHFDFIEIGTSGFDALIESAPDGLVGLSVEPLKHLQDTLPNRKNVVKISCAIGDVPGWRDIYYLPNHFMEYNNIALKGFSDAQFLYGLGRVGEISPNVLGRVGSTGWITHYIMHARRSIVRMKTIGQIYTEQQISGVTFLKLDCEGYDYKIMNSALDFFASSHNNLPIFIEFENNSNYRDAATVVDRLLQLGYLVYSFFYEVTRVAHDSSVGAPHGVIFAELGYLKRGPTDMNRAKAVNNILPADLIWGRELCSAYHNNISPDSHRPDEDGNVDHNTARYYCSILLSEDKKVLSISDKFTII